MAKPLEDRGQRSRFAAAALLLVSAGALALLAIGARPPASGRDDGARGVAVTPGQPPPPSPAQLPQPEDRWLRYVGIGDTLSKVGGTVESERGHATGLTARKAYLLAFYEAYDADHFHRMALAAQRLDSLGDHETARRIRRVLAEYPYPGQARD